MKKNTLAWVFGGMLVACGGLAGLACSSDPAPATGGDTPRPDASGGDKDATTKNDTGTVTPGNDSGPQPVGDAGTDCGDPKFNPTLHPNAEAGIYCPFRASEFEAGKPRNCATSEHCCINNQKGVESACTPQGTACAAADASTDWECAETDDCPEGNICCFTGEPVVNTTCAGDNFARGGKGTKCRPADAGACQAGEYQVCGKAAECPSGKTCTPFDVKTVQMGACL